MTCEQGLLRLLWGGGGGPKLECYGTAPTVQNLLFMESDSAGEVGSAIALIEELNLIELNCNKLMSYSLEVDL